LATAVGRYGDEGADTTVGRGGTLPSFDFGG
jgi:hypothetical protein